MSKKNVYDTDPAIVAIEVYNGGQIETGRWIHRKDIDYKDETGIVHLYGMCSKCGFIHDFLDGHTTQYNYCPQCGVKMEEI